MNMPEERSRGGVLILTLALYALVICLTVLRVRPSTVEPSDAPASEFSGVRAKALLQQLVGNGVPHPVGSVADAAVREAIVARLRQLGYQPCVQEDFVCDSSGACAVVKNVLARLDGQQSGPGVMVAAHYDSVPAGPGASDDGAGTVSVLEIARALKASSPLRHSVIFLIDEGEEAGLLGAVAFVEHDPWAKDVRAVVNMDNRGTSGSATMFETGSANEWLMRMYGKSIRHPNADSLSYTVYKTLPNDTDFTVFKAANYQGFNFAFLDDVVHYHTPLDNVANASVSSIQSEGGSALDAVRALADSDFSAGPTSDAVYQDFLGWKMIWWPARRTVGFALLALVLLTLEVVILMRRGRVRVKELLFGFISWPLSLIVGGILGAGLQFFLGFAGAMPSNWIAHPTPLLVAAWTLGFAAVALIGGVLGKKAGLWGMWAGTWLWWAIVSFLLGTLAPGLSFIFIVSAISAGVLGLAVIFADSESRGVTIAAAVVPGLVTALVGTYTVWALYVALGGRFLFGITLCVALIALPLAPLAGAVSPGRRWRFPVTAFATAAIATAIALIVSPFSKASPERINLQYLQNGDTGKSQWLAFPASGRLPLSLRSLAPFVRTSAEIYPWDRDRPLAADAPMLNLPSPTFTVETLSSSQGKVNYDVLLKSLRGAPVVSIAFSPDMTPEGVSMAGHAIPAVSQPIVDYRRGWRIYSCVDTPPEGVEMKFTMPSKDPGAIVMFDESYGLPPQGLLFGTARSSSAIPHQDGDVAIVMQHVTLKLQ